MQMPCRAIATKVVANAVQILVPQLAKVSPLSGVATQAATPDLLLCVPTPAYGRGVKLQSCSERDETGELMPRSVGTAEHDPQEMPDIAKNR